ncbi:MAG: WYL domain-containing protein, partial [Bacteroidota bacterium]
MDRPDRLRHIMLALQSNAWQRALDLAETVGVSTRTIYRDMQVLDDAGIPVVAVPGKGYSLFEGYVLDPVALTADEAAVLALAAEAAPSELCQLHPTALQTAQQKLTASLPASAQTSLDTLRAEWQQQQPPSRQAAQRWSTLHYALDAQRVVTVAIGDAEAMAFHPYAVVQHAEQAYVIGWVPSQQRVRHLRLTDLGPVALTEATFERPAGYADLPAHSIDVVIDVLFLTDAAPTATQVAPLSLVGAERHAEGWQVTLHALPGIDTVGHLLRWGRQIRVLHPPRLQRQLATEAQHIAATYAAVQPTSGL